MGKWIIAVFMLLASSLGYARQECAVADSDTYLALPQAGIEVPRGPTQIRKGQRYEVGKVQDGWIAVNVDGEFAWAKASHFAYSCDPVTGSYDYSAKRSEARKSQAHNSPSKSHKASKAPESTASAGGCPCSGRNVCIGPRGGRYCITSSGGKRYGV